MTETNRALGATSLLGIVAGVGLLIPACFAADMAFLAVPAVAVLLPSMLYGTR